MEIKNILDNVSSFLIDPSKQGRSPVSQGMAWAATIILGVGTLGIAQGVCALWRKLRHIQTNDTHEKISRLFHGTVSKSQQSSLEIAQNIIKNGDALVRAATAEASDDKENFTPILLNKIEAECQKQHTTLSKVFEDPNAVKLFLSRGHFSAAVLRYARLNKSEKLLRQHLIHVANFIYKSKKKLTGIASLQKDVNSKEKICIALMVLIRDYFHREGRSLREVFSCPEAMQVLLKSERLTLVLALYYYIINKAHQKKAPQKGPSDQVDTAQFDNDRQREARKLARAHAPSEGLVTKLRFNHLENNEEELKKAVRQFIVKNHPDKNDGEKQPLIDEALQLLELLKQEFYKEYRDELKKQRRA